MTHNHIAWLLFKHQRNELTPDEQLQLDGWLDEAPANRERFNNCYTNAEWLRTELTAFRNINVAAGKRRADRLLRKHRRQKIASYTGSAIIIIAACIYFWPRPVHEAATPTIVKKQQVSQPEPRMDSGKVFLIIEGDTTIELQNAHGGIIVQKDNLQVSKEGKRINYINPLNNGATPPFALKLVTSWSSQWELQLPDNSHIWLNAASSVRYPAPNSALARSVQLKGEGYFEIAHIESSSFGVTAGNSTEVVATGTKFNINAYPEEGRIKASLIEGEVKVNRGIEQQTLKPGESAIVQPSQPIQVFEDSTIAQSMAWKNADYFIFKNVPLSAVIREFERWYNVKIIYADTRHEPFSGRIQRSRPVETALNIAFNGQVRLRIKDREITVIPMPATIKSH